MSQENRHYPEAYSGGRVPPRRAVYRRWAFRLLTVACTLISAQLPLAAFAADSDAIEAALRNTRLGRLLP
jgi:hypothetical protein